MQMLQEPKGWYLLNAQHLHTSIVHRGDTHEPLPHGAGPWMVEFQQLPNGGNVRRGRGWTLYQAWASATRDTGVECDHDWVPDDSIHIAPVDVCYKCGEGRA